jgi:type I restriction enzyme S subunit
MIADIHPYPAYKDSGVPWLGKVPEHWDVRRLKSSVSNIIRPIAERNASDLYVALEHVESWTGRLRCAGPDVSFDSQVKQFQAGDVLFGKLRPYLAKVTRPASNGVCVGEFLVLRPSAPNATARYVEQLLRSKPIIDAVNASTFGAKMPRADWQFVGGMPIVLPSLHEQAAIVRFLDHADRRIRRYILTKQKLIKLLDEQKQAIIHQAVTAASTPTSASSHPEWSGWGMYQSTGKLHRLVG